MASLKAIRRRIASVRNTQKITKAMKMVSAAKLRRAQDAATSSRPYAEKLAAMLSNVAARAGTQGHPLLQSRDPVKSVHLLLITADRGLCGGYNSNLIRMAAAFVAEQGQDRVHLTCVGRRGFDFFKKRGVHIAGKHINLFGGLSHRLAEELSVQLQREFVAGDSDAVYLIYSHFRSTLVQTPVLERVLPLQPEARGTASMVEYLYEPGVEILLDRLLRQYVTVVVYRAFLEATASEHGARMTAMDSATSNAAEMIDRLTLEMNRARQAGITKELMEIVSGAEALKG